MDLDKLGPAWSGWTINAGELNAPEWRRGVTPGEIRALPYLFASQAEHKRMARELIELRRRLEAMARLAGWYRRQLTRESRLGLALSRILG